MREILIVPEWMGSLHWLVIGGALWGLAFYAWLFWWEIRRLKMLVMAVGCTSAAVIASCFWLIQSRTWALDPVGLFAIERAFWWPLLLSMAVMVDLVAADANGHRSLLTRLTIWLCREWDKRKGNEPNGGCA